MNIVTCGIDIAKLVFHIHCIGKDGEVVISKVVSRSKLLRFFANIPPCLIGMEACASAHYWARELTKLGHTVRLMAPQFVKPYVQGNKNDSNDAAGICEAVLRPRMRFVGIKTIEQQDALLVHRSRALKLKARTALINHIRGLLAEYGITLPKGADNLRKGIVDVIADDDRLSSIAREQFHLLYEELLLLDGQIERTEARIMERFRSCELCRRLATLPGIGWITATALVAYIGDIKQFKNGRELAAYFGLVPRQHSTGGRNVLLGISKRGDSYIRTLLIHGARTVQQHAGKKADRDGHSRWLTALTERRGKNKAAVAQANKTARRAWALMTHGTVYRAA